MRLAAFFLSIALSACAFAQYPSKPIRLVVPFPPGGTADVAARILGQGLSKRLGQSVLIENKAGADGAIAGTDVMRSAPDGYTLLWGTNTGMSALPAMRKNPPYDPLADFTPVSLGGLLGFFLYASPALPAKSMDELVAHVRANPGKLNYATGNSMSIVSTAQLLQAEKLDVHHVPYKGDAPAFADLLAGRIEFMIAAGTGVSYVKDGRLRALATLLPTRSGLLPDVPTLEEGGRRAVSVTSWNGVLGPAKMPSDLTARLSREIQAVLASAEAREAMARHAFEAKGLAPEEFRAFLAQQLDAWRRAVRELNLAQD